MVQLQWKTVKKLKIELPYDPVIPFLTLYTETRIDARTPGITAAVCTIPKTWKQPQCPLTDEWIKM